MAHEHSVFDQDPHFIVDEHTRQITYQGDTLPQIVQYDHNSERLTFQLPKVIDGHDMTLCNDVLVNYINIDSSTKETSKGAYQVEDMAVLESDETKIALSWLISGNATKFAGKLNFMLCFMCRDADTNITYKWNTLINSELTVGNGMDNGEAIVEEYADILQQWEEEIFGAGDSVMSNISALGSEQREALKTEGERQKEAIELKGAETLATIPADYTTVYNMAEEALRKKANAIVLDAEGETIAVDDSSDSPLLGLKLYGKSTQDGEPSPENPQEINGVENAVVKIIGKNLWNHENDVASLDNISSWGTAIWRTEAVVEALKPNTTYTMSFDVTCLAIPDYETLFSDNCGFVLYSGEDSGAYVEMAMSTGKGAFSVGEKRSAVATFKTPSNVDDVSAKYEILRYTQRFLQSDGTPVYATVRFENVQLEEGTVATAYENYVDGGYITIPRTLHGIPVSSGGNYTDANGQQWICDEVDLARGVYIQRVGAKVLDGSEDEYWFTQGARYYTAIAGKRSNRVEVTNALLCSHFKVKDALTDTLGYVSETYYGGGNINVLFNYDNGDGGVENFRTWLQSNPVTLWYVLANPVETALTDEEIARYKQLRTNYHNTTVLNDSGAYMAIKYNADTEIFLEKQAQPSDEQVADAVTAYFEENPVAAGATEEQVKQIEQNKTDIESLGKNKLDSAELQSAIDTALAQAKESGEFDGGDGQPGSDGKDGSDGITPHIGDNGNWFIGDTDTGKPSRGEAGNDGNPGADGLPGQDGTSPVVSVSDIEGGHRITITDANGEKSIDVMDGQPGADGSPGEAGEDGYTPVKGKDYFTDADKEEIVNAVLANFTDVSEVGA